MTPEIIDEVQFTRSENFHLGEFIYMGMGKVKEQEQEKVWIRVKTSISQELVHKK